MMQQRPIRLDGVASPVDGVSPQQHRRIARHHQGHQRQLAGWRVHQGPDPQHPGGEHHRLDEDPHEADVMTAVAGDDLAHDQRADHPGLDRQRAQEVRLRCRTVHQSACSLTAATSREVRAQTIRLSSSVAATFRSALGSIATSGWFGRAMRSMYSCWLIAFARACCSESSATSRYLAAKSRSSVIPSYCGTLLESEERSPATFAISDPIAPDRTRARFSRTGICGLSLAIARTSASCLRVATSSARSAPTSWSCRSDCLSGSYSDWALRYLERARTAARCCCSALSTSAVAKRTRSRRARSLSRLTKSSLILRRSSLMA